MADHRYLHSDDGPISNMLEGANQRSYSMGPPDVRDFDCEHVVMYSTVRLEEPDGKLKRAATDMRFSLRTHKMCQ